MRLHITGAFENVLKAVVRNNDPRELELDAEQATAETIQKDDEG